MVTDPAMKRMAVSPTLSQSGTYIWTIKNTTIGSYLLSVSGAKAPCQYRVMARSSLDFFFGTSPSLTSDATSPQPIYSELLLKSSLSDIKRTDCISLIDAQRKKRKITPLFKFRDAFVKCLPES